MSEHYSAPWDTEAMQMHESMRALANAMATDPDERHRANATALCAEAWMRISRHVAPADAVEEVRRAWASYVDAHADDPDCDPHMIDRAIRATLECVLLRQYRAAVSAGYVVPPEGFDAPPAPAEHTQIMTPAAIDASIRRRTGKPEPAPAPPRRHAEQPTLLQ